MLPWGAVYIALISFRILWDRLRAPSEDTFFPFCPLSFNAPEMQGVWSAGPQWMNGWIHERHMHRASARGVLKKAHVAAIFASNSQKSWSHAGRILRVAGSSPVCCKAKWQLLRWEFRLWFDLSFPENRSHVCDIYNPLPSAVVDMWYMLNKCLLVNVLPKCLKHSCNQD